MKYKGKEIKAHLRENVGYIDEVLRNETLSALLWSKGICINSRDILYLGDTAISLPELQEMYGSDISKHDLIEKGKDYLVESVLDRYTVTQYAEPGVKVMYCKAHVVYPFEDLSTDVFIPIFTCVSIPRHSVIYTSGDDSKRRASAGKITNILWYPTHTRVECVFIPKTNSLSTKPIGRVAELVPYETSDNQVTMLINDRCDRSPNRVIRIELDDYNPKTKTTDTVYSIFELKKYVSFISFIDYIKKNYTHLARHIGYFVKIDDFDITPCTCSKGFHFFDSIDEANDYISI